MTYKPAGPYCLNYVAPCEGTNVGLIIGIGVLTLILISAVFVAGFFYFNNKKAAKASESAE